MGIYAAYDKRPSVNNTCYVAETAAVIGDVRLGAGCGVWPHAVLHADSQPIEVGEDTSIRDGVVIHNECDTPVRIGRGVIVDNGAVLQGCVIGDGTRVGVRAVIFGGAVIGRHCIVADGTLVPQGATFPDATLIAGMPAHAVRALTPDEIVGLGKDATGQRDEAVVLRRQLTGSMIQRAFQQLC
ncbi:gamma carbonic anhydrase family protein [Hydrogenophaga sp.]|uniref:gamma carbonic anhydrase family protein n=1 Tax=Hydrogenophaga sp. TaxID=1904254 RepID=UPI0027313F7C|nr:gamma carbonic anhydrase family protein [Hydrogenophaga sp.]MDP2016376.1 gamma carbonic anhydrase family protein [Hydrogenophaga sp.]MDP3166133.1 gamma carbonic anhydrase family protein [Hydrogenophaga sp.]MDP3812368.1 gamma carbonic anhydrase family protein [Hydrogenophaga sp.]